MDALLYVGPSKVSIEAARNAIIDIITAPAGDAVKERALRVFATVCAVGNTSITSCHLVNNEASNPRKKGNI